HPEDELVVAARISSAVALSVGWHLTQHTCHLYRNTYLMYFHGDRIVPMRVRASQPERVEPAGHTPRERARGRGHRSVTARNRGHRSSRTGPDHRPDPLP